MQHIGNMQVSVRSKYVPGIVVFIVEGWDVDGCEKV